MLGTITEYFLVFSINFIVIEKLALRKHNPIINFFLLSTLGEVLLWGEAPYLVDTTQYGHTTWPHSGTSSLRCRLRYNFTIIISFCKPIGSKFCCQAAHYGCAGSVVHNNPRRCAVLSAHARYRRGPAGRGDMAAPGAMACSSFPTALCNLVSGSEPPTIRIRPYLSAF